jgi:mannan endo-1,4-beta-mannosidase
VASSAAKGFDTDGVKITDANTILSVHVYSEAYVAQKHGTSKNREGWLDIADLDDLASAGRPCMIGEFGTSWASAPRSSTPHSQRTTNRVSPYYQSIAALL